MSLIRCYIVAPIPPKVALRLRLIERLNESLAARLCLRAAPQA